MPKTHEPGCATNRNAHACTCLIEVAKRAIKRDADEIKAVREKLQACIAREGRDSQVRRNLVQALVHLNSAVAALQENA